MLSKAKRCPVTLRPTINIKTEMILMSVAVWRMHLFSCSWPAIHDHKGFPIPGKGADKPHGCISKLSFTMAGGAYHTT